MTNDRATPRVAVVVPAYNVTKFIAEALESVRVQTYRDFEVIVVNDGCPDTDGLEAVLRPFAAEIRYLRQENGGVAAARNTAIRVSRATYIALLDADDVWEPRYLERQVGFLERHPEYDVVYPDATLFGDSPLAGRRYMDVTPSRGEVTLDSLLTARCNVFISVLGKREMFVKAGLFDPALRAAEDFDLWLRILLTGGRIGYQREILARRRKHSESLSADTALQARRGLVVLHKALADPRLPPAAAELVRRNIDRFSAVAELWDGKRALSERRAADAIRHFATANRFFRSAKLTLVVNAIRLAPMLTGRLYELRSGNRARGPASVR
jgi:glycosyltransferase involved in cell wall biosynthesis